MSWFDWLILVLPVCFVMGMGFYTRRYVRGMNYGTRAVADSYGIPANITTNGAG